MDVGCYNSINVHFNNTMLQFCNFGFRNKLSLSGAWKQPSHKGFWRTWTKHDEKANLVLSPNLKYKGQGQKHEICVQNVCWNKKIMKTCKKPKHY